MQLAKQIFHKIHAVITYFINK